MADQDQTNHGDITDSSVQFGQARRDLKQVQGDDRSLTIIFNQTFSQSTRTWSDRQARILAKMQEDVQTRLDFTLNDDDVLIPLRMKPFGERLGKASLKLRRKLKIDQQAEQDLDLNEAIAQVFCRPDVRKKLLILGAPGAGKTTTLLTLAKDLLEGAIANPGTVIPIVFELSTWKTGAIGNWLAEQLKDAFNLSIEEGEAWIRDEILLPLLDGLDELSLEQQEQCITALNAFANHYSHLVVCCRVREYIDGSATLDEIDGQICLEPLSDEQIENYLNDIELGELWQDIQGSSDMQKMLEDDEDGNPGILRLPLLLSIAALSYEGKPFASRAELYHTYVDQRLSRDVRQLDRRFKAEQQQWAYKTVRSEPNPVETQRLLTVLARWLKGHYQVELIIEELQPRLIENKLQQWLYWLLLFIGNTLSCGIVITVILLLWVPLGQSFVHNSNLLLM